MQIEFPRERDRALAGLKADSVPAIVVSSTSNTTTPFGVLVVYDDTDAFLCKLPVPGAPLDKPLGITLRQLDSQHYESKNSIAVMRVGRVWVQAEKVSAPGDAVYVHFAEDGSAAFSGDKEGNTKISGAVFLEKTDGGLVPIEVNFLGGVQ